MWAVSGEASRAFLAGHLEDHVPFEQSEGVDGLHNDTEEVVNERYAGIL